MGAGRASGRVLTDETRPAHEGQPWPLAAITLFIALAAVYTYVSYHAMRGGTVAGLQGTMLRNLALLVLAALFLTGFLVGRILAKRRRAILASRQP